MILYLAFCLITPPPERTVLNCLSEQTIELAGELGLNLVGVSIDTEHPLFDHVVREPEHNQWENNAVLEVCEAADDQNLRACIFDGRLSGRFRGERVMLHPESADDFVSRGSYSTADDGDFLLFPIDDNPCSTTLLQRTGGSNCVIMDGNAGTISGVTVNRMRELSVYRNWTSADSHRVSGMYQVSVILKPLVGGVNPLPNDDDTPVLNVDIWYTDPSDNSTQRIRLPLHGSRLWEGPTGSRTQITDIREYVLGEIELQQAGANDRILYVTQGVHGNQATPWWRSEAVGGSTRMDYSESTLLDIRGDFDISLSYGDDDVRVRVDAICLTNPATFGLWQSDNDSTLHLPAIPPNTPAVDHSLHRAAMEHRLASICSDDGETSNPMPGLRFLAGPEQSFSNGTYWTTFLLSRLLAEESGGQVELYIPQGSETNTDITPVISTEFVSGIYHYPLLTSDPRPTLATTTRNNYYNALYHQGGGDGFSGMWNLLRLNLETRSQYNPAGAWIPFIQNHSNLMTNNPPPGWYDGVPNREPSASELRYQCNSVLALGAKGVMFWQFSSSPFAPTVNMDVEDRILPNPTVPWTSDFDEDMGSMGFLGDMGVETLPREHDWNGENKWDSTRMYIANFLNPIGSFMARHLIWERGIQWQNQNGSTSLVSGVIGQRLDVASGIDPQNSTYVTVGEFTQNPSQPPENVPANARYLFVVNGRTYDGLSHEGTDQPVGQRHITVKLGTLGETVTHWWVTNQLTSDGWIFQASDDPDDETNANGFTDYFRPGAAALYQVRPISAYWVGGGTLFIPGNLHVNSSASIEMVGQDLQFSASKGLYVEGMLHASNTQFSCEDAEEHWEGIFARNGGSVTLTDACTVTGGRGGAGPGSTLTLDEATTFTFSCDTCAVLNALGGTISSAGTIAEVPDSGVYLAAWYGAEVTLAGDSAFALTPSNTGVGILNSASSIVMTGTRLYDQYSGIVGADLATTQVWGSWLEPGLNRIRSGTIALEVSGDATIDLGFSACKRNSVHVENIDPGYHIINNNSGLSLWADSVYWSHGMTQNIWPIPKTTGTGQNSTDDPLPYDPVPFTGGDGQFSKTAGGSITRDWRSDVREASARNQTQTMRNVLSSALNSRSVAPTLVDLAEIAHWTRQYGLQDLRDTLYTALLSRPDMGSKLLAVDMAAEDSLFTDAADILDSYSFAGSPALCTRALLRKAVIHPLAYEGGYVRGLQALDSAKALLGNSARYRSLFELYPKLYSGLTHTARPSSPKAHAQSLLDRVIPSTIEIGSNYPNPFSTLTSFTFKLPDAREVRLTVHDMLGREIAVLKEGRLDRGIHSAVLHAERLSAGMYLYRLQAGAEVRQGKMVLVR